MYDGEVSPALFSNISDAQLDRQVHLLDELCPIADLALGTTLEGQKERQDLLLATKFWLSEMTELRHSGLKKADRSLNVEDANQDLVASHSGTRKSDHQTKLEIPPTESVGTV